MFGCVDAEQGQATGQHRPGGFGEREPGTVGGRGFLRTTRKDDGEKGENGIGDDDEMPGQAIGGVVRGGGPENTGVIGEDVPQEGHVGYDGFRYGGLPRCRFDVGVAADVDVGVGVRVGVAPWVHVPGLGVEAQVGGVAGESPGAGVGVTDPEERVALPLDQVVVADAGPVVRSGMQ